MADETAIRHYLVIPPPGGFYPIGVDQAEAILAAALGTVGLQRADLQGVSFSGAGWQRFLPDRPPEPVYPNALIVAFSQSDTEIMQALAKLEALGTRQGVDLTGVPALHWCPGAKPDAGFDTADGAMRRIRSGYLAERGATGKGVNIAIIDEGFDATRYRANYGGGWAPAGREPGVTKGGHGNMIVRNLLRIAPEATVWDCPVLPFSEIEDLPGFLSQIETAYRIILQDIRQAGSKGIPGGPWLFVNAWAVFDRSFENPPGDYTERPGHPFNLIVGEAVGEPADVVFAAGNCGEFCPDGRCGPLDRGPGKSIFGANALARVVTVGAVRTDGMWIGQSSQGPGPPRIATEKPDLCAPSQFREPGDAHLVNGGTSAACALTAGVVAALRSRWDGRVLPPDRMRAILTQTARPTAVSARFRYRFGAGIVDAQGAYDAAAASFDRG